MAYIYVMKPGYDCEHELRSKLGMTSKVVMCAGDT